jgi:hypothetical protein
MISRTLACGLCASTFVIGYLSAGTLTASGEQATALDARIRGAQDVVVARAQSMTPRWAVNAFGDRLIVSRVQLQIEETLKGAAAGTFSVDIEGGTLDGVTLRVSSMPVLKPGDRAVFMLERGDSGAYQLHLRGQGVLILDEGNLVSGTDIRVDDIRRLARPVSR